MMSASVISMIISSFASALSCVIGIYLLSRIWKKYVLTSTWYLRVAVAGALIVFLLDTTWYFMKFQTFTWGGILAGICWFVTVFIIGWLLFRMRGLRSE